MLIEYNKKNINYKFKFNQKINNVKIIINW